MSRPSRRGLTALVLLGCAALPLLAACGPSADAGTSGSAAGGAPSRGGMQPGVSGLIAEVDGSTVQIQGATEQTAVTWSKDTTFTLTASATRAAVAKGDCVRVQAADASSSAATEVTATSVAISPAVDGACTGFGMGGGRMGPGGGTPPSGMPSGMPSEMPSGGAPDGARRMPTAGLITAVDTDTLTVSVTAMGGQSAAPTAVTVHTTDDTTYTAQKASSSAAAKVGVCAFARGTSTDTGAVKATAIALSPAVDGACTNGRPSGQPSRG